MPLYYVNNFCKEQYPALRIELQGDEEVTDELMSTISPLEKYVEIGRTNNRENWDKPIRISLTKKAFEGRVFERLAFLWKNEGLNDDMFENANIHDLHLATPVDSPFQTYPKNIAKLCQNPNFILEVSGCGIPTFGAGFHQLIDERKQKNQENDTKPKDQQEKIYEYTFWC